MYTAKMCRVSPEALRFIFKNKKWRKKKWTERAERCEEVKIAWRKLPNGDVPFDSTHSHYNNSTALEKIHYNTLSQQRFSASMRLASIFMHCYLGKGEIAAECAFQHNQHFSVHVIHVTLDAVFLWTNFTHENISRCRLGWARCIVLACLRYFFVKS